MTSNARAGEPLLGSLHSADGNGVVRMEDRFDTEIEDLWSAFTDPRRLAGWFADVDGDLRLGGEFRARIFFSGEATGRIDACEPPRRLLLTLRDGDPQPGQPDREVNEVTLTPDRDHSIMVWEVRGMPLNLIAAYGAGVQLHLEDLAHYLGGRESWRADPERFDKLMAAYKPLAAKIS